MTLGLGIDTGGTYTDSVIVDIDTGEVICRSKALTTHEDLSKGIEASIKGLGHVKDISLVSLSTTLATNSVVEGKSCRVGLILIGRRPKNVISTTVEILVPGEFDLRGNIVRELDTEYAVSQISAMKGKVDVVAVAGYLSVRYPEHENKVRDTVAEILGVPTVCAHELTSKLGFEERVNTAAMNAGLIPIIIELIGAVRASLDRFGIHAPLMIVKGDGSVMNVPEAMKRPVETIMSGPASSITSAMLTAGVENGLVVDMGGTTTDIGIIRGGFVHTLDTGSVIGGYRTRVRAADVSTYGIGGDSGITVKDGEIIISKVRSVPLCISSDPSYRKGNVESGLTPTDLLAAEGTYKEYPAEMSKKVVSEYANDMGISDSEFIIAAKRKVAEKIASSIQDHINRITTEKESFYEHIITSGDDSNSVNFRDLPLIGIGAPAGVWISQAAEILGMELIFPKNYDVGNAIGAISSSVTEYVELAVRASPNDFSEDPQCRVYTGEDSFFFKNKKDAMDYALSEGERLAKERAKRSGAKEIRTDVRVDEILLQNVFKGKKLFRGADVIVRASGRPDIRSL